MRVETKPFLAALTEACRIVARPSQTTVPILSCVGIAAGAGAAELFATDLDVELSRVLPVSGSLERIAVAAHELERSLKVAAKGSTLTLEIVEPPRAATPRPPEGTPAEDYPKHMPAAPGRVRIKSDCGGVDVIMRCEHGDELPRLAARAEAGSAMLPGAVLRSALAAVEHCMSDEESRYYLCGAFLHVRTWHGTKRLCVVAVDGHRLAFKAMAGLTPEALECPNVILPRLAVETLLRNLPTGDGAVRMVWHNGDAAPDAKPDVPPPGPVRFTFYGDGVTVTTKLVDGTFPDYQRVIPTGNQKRAVFKTADMARAMKDAKRILGSEKQGGRAIKLSLADGESVVTAVNTETRAAFRRAIKSEVHFDSFDIGFNCEYMAAHCAALDGDLELVFEDAGAPTLVRDTADADWIGVIMPVRV